ncbi:MAG: class I SAM-dependent methyltransferase [Myxococcales bacterium]|nr:class I SAM-dependent methyltransferase [Myxococcales bacterium]
MPSPQASWSAPGLPEGRRSLTAYAYHFGPGVAYQPAHRFIAADIDLQEGVWLDIGCGPGWLAIFAGAGKPELDVVGIDTSKTMISLAEDNKQGRLNVTFREMDAREVVYPQHTFDVVTAVQTAHHWDDPAGILAEAFRVLKPGGRMFIYEADPEATIPRDWIRRRGIWPPDSFLKRRWKQYGMDQARWDQLKAVGAASPFGTECEDDRHGFYRRLVLTRR